ncbi:hypothetical protein ACOSQ4_029220 [Xanthoceras sorbifolium]
MNRMVVMSDDNNPNITEPNNVRAKCKLIVIYSQTLFLPLLYLMATTSIPSAMATTSFPWGWAHAVSPIIGYFK